MKVAHVIAPGVGGAETVVRRLAEASVRDGRDVIVAGLVEQGAAPPLAGMLEASGVRFFPISCGRRRYRAEVRALAELLEREAVDLVHSHLYHADVVSYFAARARGIPATSTVHGFTGEGWRQALYVWLDFFVLRRFDGVACVSKGVRERVVDARVDPAKTHLIQNGYTSGSLLSRAEARATLGLATDQVCLGWVGRMSSEKGPDLFLDVLAALDDESVTGVMIGDGRGSEAIHRRATERGLETRVRFAGRVDDAARYFSAFDVYLLSSRAEANPMVVLEAISARVPVVAFDVGDVSDMLDDSVARLVSAGDVAGMARAVEAVLKDSAGTAARLDRAARDLADRFGADRWLREIDAMYAAVMNARKKIRK